IADARAGASARSRLGNDVVIAGGADLAVDAQVMPGASYAARAEATTGAGAGLVGAVGARATARSTTTAAATTGARLTLPAGTVRIEAYNRTSQYARGAGRANAAIAAGLVDVAAESSSSTVASLGHSARADGDRAGDITIRARGINADRADAISGTGGVIAGSAAETRTKSNGDVRAEIAECGL